MVEEEQAVAGNSLRTVSHCSPTRPNPAKLWAKTKFSQLILTKALLQALTIMFPAALVVQTSSLA